MKKLALFFVAFLIMSSSLLLTGTKEVEAACYLSTPSDVEILDDSGDTDGDVNIMCSGGNYPRGWINLRNTAKPMDSTSIKQWRKTGTHSTAVSDLTKYLAKYPEHTIVNYGGGKIRVITGSHGDIMLYPVSKSYGESTIKFNAKNEAIRYFK
ncbi:hypothetical protein [Salirhabdus sp. Marseille-P4669]|uniref:hypothetical protein n=1 Tax=Salirhabdus sp. Marseille-P4669 TaxID=2042310 RepID=UPI0011AEDAC7|nr:hypothetical protein [Salirhabdus sp. Marseille-P4669]